MQIAMVGLGRMGSNMARRLAAGGHECLVYDLDASAVAALREEGIEGAESLEDLVARLSAPRTVWIMVPAGEATERVVGTLAELLEAGDILIDGGNSYFKDDVRRAGQLAERGLNYMDAGTSGGVWGRERGYCLMVGGPHAAFQHIEPALETLAPGPAGVVRTPGRSGDPTMAEKGYLYCGPAGAGHYVKMVHNGIEYGLMQAYAEGFDLMRSAGSEQQPAEYRYDLDIAGIAELWRRGSVVGSWLLDLTATALQADPGLDRYSGYVEDSGEGRWTVQAAVEQAVPAEVMTAALYARFRSRQDHTFAEKVLSAMREQFGGHVEQGAGDPD